MFHGPETIRTHAPSVSRWLSVGAALLSCLATLGLSACGAVSMAKGGELAGRELEEFAAFVAAAHPDQANEASRAAFAAQIRSEAAALRARGEPSSLEIGAALQRVAASLHDSHIAVAHAAFQPQSEHPPSFVPLAIELLDSQVLIDATTVEVEPGTRVLAIDQEPIAQVLESFNPLLVFETTADAGRERALVSGFGSLYALTHGSRPSYQLLLRGPSGVEQTITAAGIDREGLRALDARRHSAAMRGIVADRLPTLDSPRSGTALLRLPSFGVADSAAFYARLADAVARIGGFQKLIIDLRGNEGGLRTYGIELLNHLAKKPYAQWDRTGARLASLPARFESKVAAAFGTSVDRLNLFAGARMSAGLLWVDGDPLQASMTPKSPYLDVPLAVLIDGHTNSAAIEFVVALRQVRPEALLIGEETGGRCDHHIGELPVTFNLSATGSAVLMSLLYVDHVDVPGCRATRGFEPDVPVTYHIEDFVAGRDPVLEAALARLFR